MNYFALFLPVLLSACVWNYGDIRAAENPDPNHTHADFAMYVHGEKIDFSDNAYMSGLSTDDNTHDEEHEYHHEHLHLHDGVGHVIHRHKPGLSLSEFFASIGFELTYDCVVMAENGLVCNDEGIEWKMVMNGEPTAWSPDYVFEDLDQILMSYGATDEQLAAQWEEMTDDACLYSRTCPQRGDPPAENCVADPAVPCVAPLDE